MEDFSKVRDMLCDSCGGEMSLGPIGLQCMRCLLSLANTDEAFADVADLFPELEIHNVIARGGFGSVYLAEQRRMKRRVALKLFDSWLNHTPAAVDLFEREMVTVASLSHPGIVQAFDAGDREGLCYLIMELVDGDDCGALLRRHDHLPVAESCEIVRQAAVAMHHAHEKGLVHRDVKPGNLMLSRHAPTVKVCDFGLASIALAPLAESDRDLSEKTSAGHFLGTLEYIAPEQIAHPEQVDARADIYALGATLRRLLTGKPAREGISEQTLMRQALAVTTESVDSIATLRPDLPPTLVKLCDQLMAFSPADRPATAAEVATLMKPWTQGAELLRLFDPPPLAEKPFVLLRKIRRRKLMLAASLCIAFSGIAAGYHFWQKSTSPSLNTEPTWKPVFSQAYMKERGLSLENAPRLMSDEWEHDREVADHMLKSAARLTPSGEIVRIDSGQDFPLQWSERKGLSPAVKIKAKMQVASFGIAPSGHYVWSMPNEKTGKHIGRALPDGTPLSPLHYDFASDYPPGVYELGRKILRKFDQPTCDAQPWGFAFVTEKNLPAHTGLKAGDVIVADGGHRGIPNQAETDSALWTFRLDGEAPAKRLKHSAGAEHFFVDVAVTQHGVFVLDRLVLGPERVPKDDPRNLNRRLLRWDLDGLHPCRFDQPIVDPSGLAADPLSDDLYIIQGAANLTVDPSLQRVLRLTPAAKDEYRAEVFAERFGQLGANGISISEDGQHMILTDEGSRSIVVLKRKKK